MRKTLLLLFFILTLGIGFYFSPFYSQLKLPVITLGQNPPNNQVVAAANTKNPSWDPQIFKPNVAIAPPVVTAKAALAAEITTDKIIFSKNQDLRLPTASVQKIVTAMVALDNLQEDTIVIISANAASKEPDIMGLFPGEKLTVKQLLYGLLLVSGNDSATALAEKVSGNENDFAQLMTKKAQSLGLQNSEFSNASGLDEGYQYSSAFDMAVFSVDLVRNYPLLGKIIGTTDYRIYNTVDDTENHKDYYLHNTSPLLDIPGYLGVKPGYTPQAEWCLVTLVGSGTREYLIVVLGSQDRKGDTLALIDYLKAVYP